MFAPSPPRSADEIVSTILEACQQKAKDHPGVKLNADKIEPEIRGSILALQASKGDGPARGFWIDNKDWAEKLQKWVADGDALFAKMPISFRWTLFDDLYEASIRLPRFLTALGWFGRRCAVILQTKAGAERPLTEPEKEQAAMAARYIMECCGLPLTHTNEGGPYRRIASLLYEATGGAADLDLRRQCETIAKLPNASWQELQRRLYLLINYTVAVKDADSTPDKRPIVIGDGD